jgi:hypothetical protein
MFEGISGIYLYVNGNITIDIKKVRPSFALTEMVADPKKGTVRTKPIILTKTSINF